MSRPTSGNLIERERQLMEIIWSNCQETAEQIRERLRDWSVGTRLRICKPMRYVARVALGIALLLSTIELASVHAAQAALTTSPVEHGRRADDAPVRAYDLPVPNSAS